ncbi:hypothetical protein PCE1_002512 [Barthelona sp. PCE]
MNEIDHENTKTTTQNNTKTWSEANFPPIPLKDGERLEEYKRRVVANPEIQPKIEVHNEEALEHIIHVPCDLHMPEHGMRAGVHIKEIPIAITNESIRRYHELKENYGNWSEEDHELVSRVDKMVSEIDFACKTAKKDVVTKLENGRTGITNDFKPESPFEHVCEDSTSMVPSDKINGFLFLHKFKKDEEGRDILVPNCFVLPDFYAIQEKTPFMVPGTHPDDLEELFDKITGETISERVVNYERPMLSHKMEDLDADEILNLDRLAKTGHNEHILPPVLTFSRRPKKISLRKDDLRVLLNTKTSDTVTLESDDEVENENENENSDEDENYEEIPDFKITKKKKEVIIQASWLFVNRDYSPTPSVFLEELCKNIKMDVDSAQRCIDTRQESVPHEIEGISNFSSYCGIINEKKSWEFGYRVDKGTFKNVFFRWGTNPYSDSKFLIYQQIHMVKASLDASLFPDHPLALCFSFFDEEHPNFDSLINVIVEEPSISEGYLVPKDFRKVRKYIKENCLEPFLLKD